MSYGINPEDRYCYGEVNDEDRRRFLKALGVATGAGAVGLSLDDLRRTLGGSTASGTADEFAEMGEAVRTGLTGSIDSTLLHGQMAALTDSFDALPQLQAAGVPGLDVPEVGTGYQSLTPAAWAIGEHLADVSFFESAEAALPSFTGVYIEETARQLIEIGAVEATLGDLAVSAQEQEALVMNIVNTSEQLSWWMPTIEYDPREAPHEFIPPLHHRAAAGSLLWIDGLDWHLWQNSVLITQEMVDHALWDIKSMLAGFSLLSEAALGVAEESITDTELATITTASTALMIIAQEFFISDIVRITDHNRASRVRTVLPALSN